MYTTKSINFFVVCTLFVLKKEEKEGGIIMRPSVSKVLEVARLVNEANTALSKAYEIIASNNNKGRQFDYTIVPASDIGLDHLLTLVDKIKRMYFQEE